MTRKTITLSEETWSKLIASKYKNNLNSIDDVIKRLLGNKLKMEIEQRNK